MSPRRPNPRKLLVASIGVATLNYLPTACSPVANLMAPPGAGGGRSRDGGVDAADAKPRQDVDVPPSPTVANLLAPALPSQSDVPAKKER